MMGLMGHLSLQCYVCMKFCKLFPKYVFILFSFFATAVYLADKNLQTMANPTTEFKPLLDEYRKMLDQSFCKYKDLDDVLRFLRILPGVVVQRHMSFQVMADLYRIKPDLLKGLIKSTIELLSQQLGSHGFRYALDEYMSGFLQDRDRSQLYYCDPMLQHISICRQFLSLLNGSNAFDLQS